ncbi:TIR domain-containing adapter molecule 2 [Tiliqua scincoides]|uniref:TIR domain-containing adapter molecule 2 n=1 Tax=Tiliqua scincoides TaxID=71010 RepID=UPI0034621F87
MGNGHSKRTSLIFPRTSVKDNHTQTRQLDLKQKPKLHELSLGTESSGHTYTQEESQSSEEDVGEIFYRFVILHAEDDEEEAVRVQDLLQNEFCIKPGIIFAEMPSGRHLLENFQKAITGSAWTIILLTENFLSELWCTFQSYTSLYNALTIPHKCNTVIPMRPRNNPLPWEKTPFILQSIKALQEDSPGFAEQVKKTFQESRYRQQQAMWRNQKKGMARELLCW